MGVDQVSLKIFSFDRNTIRLLYTFNFRRVVSEVTKLSAKELSQPWRCAPRFISGISYIILKYYLYIIFGKEATFYVTPDIS
jgi:hypothetical protein